MFKTFLILITLSTSLFASSDEEEFPFLGVTFSSDRMSSSTLSTEDEYGFGFRYGKQSVGWRTMFSYSGNSDIKNFELEIDNILNDTIDGLENMRVYVGGKIGLFNYRDVNSSLGYTQYFGGSVGVLYYLTHRLDLDLSYHYNNIEKFEPLSRMKGVTLSLHYFY